MSTKLYVGNLSWDTKAEDLYALFGKFGTVVSWKPPSQNIRGSCTCPGFAMQCGSSSWLPAWFPALPLCKSRQLLLSQIWLPTALWLQEDAFVPTDRETGRPRGFGFVTLPTDAAKAAIADADGTEFMGRSVRWANSERDGDPEVSPIWEG